MNAHPAAAPLSDTSPDAAAVQNAMFERMTPSQRLSTGFRFSQAIRDLKFTGLRRDHPDWCDRTIRHEILRRQIDPAHFPPFVQ